MRARIDITEVEARTKIRAKYLRAIENEEWDLLPGPVYVKSFLRTYGDFLGLDSRLLVDEYKRRYERPIRPRAAPDRDAQPRARARRPAGPLLPPWAIIGGRAGRGRRRAVRARQRQQRQDDAGRRRRATHEHAPRTRHRAARTTTHAPTAKPTTVKLQLVPTGTRLRCLRRRHGQEADPGPDLQPGQTIPTETRLEAAADARQRLGADEGQRRRP